MKRFVFTLLLIAQPVLASALPRPDHVVIVVEENRAFHQIIGSAEAPYLNQLAGRGMLFTNSHAVAHPSQPNYLALFAGTTYGIDSDICPLELRGPNLAEDLIKHALNFAVYSEGLPAAGARGCGYGDYRRKHNPAANWSDLAAANLPFGAFPQDFSRLPTVSWVIPDLQHDMHDGTIAQGDAWLKQHLAAYTDWAEHHNSLLIITWDEDDRWSGNHIATLFVGQPVRRGGSAQRIDHYDVLRTVEAMYGLTLLNNSARAHTIEGVWVEKNHRSRQDAKNAK